MMRFRRGVSLVLLAWVGATACRESHHVRKRVVVLGLDGMDYQLTSRLIKEGKLPNLARLADMGSFTPLGTSLPPQSPVAWSDFITGMDAGGHGIFDFIHRRPETMEPYLSTSETEPPGHTLHLGRWQIPLTGGKPELLRRGVPFWQVLEENGIPTTIMRIPANFPPSGTASRELSGMGTPDLLGGYGTFSFYTTTPERYGKDVSGGRIYRADFVDDVFNGKLVGPPNPLRTDAQEMVADFTVYRDHDRPIVEIHLGDQALILREGEWSDWVHIGFHLAPLAGDIKGMVRLYVKEVHPDFELYVSPINIDPADPAMPISTPHGFAAEISASDGPFYTQGMPEDTKALLAGVLDDREFLQQANLAFQEELKEYYQMLDQFDDGLLFYYFGFADQVSHMMWRPMDPGHPAYVAERDAPLRRVVEGMYEKADAIVGETMKSLGDSTTLIVLSDHGFTSWRRAFNLNTWLLENGYLALRGGDATSDAPFLQDVDWSKTTAYGLGLTGLYLNLRGRERFGIVPPLRYRPLRDEIAERLEKVVDPATGQPAIRHVYKRDEAYSNGGYRDIGPDLVIGYARGTRSSDASAEGTVPAGVFADNTSEWSGDHIMDPEVVPGVLFTSHPLATPPHALKDVAVAVLEEFGIRDFPRKSVGAGDTKAGR